MEGMREERRRETRKSPPHTALQKCPRCDSANTKFCYYNNYSRSQPRFYCKACRRYWTQGGTLRNVPVGGGCRKNKRAKNALAAGASPSSSIAPAAVPPPLPPALADPAVSASQYGFGGGQFSSMTWMPQPMITPGVSSTPSALTLLRGFCDLSGPFAAAQQDQMFVNLPSNNQLGGFSRNGNDPLASSSPQDPWPPQSFGNYAPVWNTGPGSMNSGASGPPLGPNQWPDLPRSSGSPPP